jgi:hypothetical protein
MGFDGRRFIWYPIVAVPARNEAQRLPSLIDSLGRQTWLAGGQERRLPVVLILNNCNDYSVYAAVRAAARHRKLLLDVIQINFPPAQAHVGSARRLAMERALELANNRARSVLLTTDADAIPRCDWIENNLQAINAGAALVGGHIVGDKMEEALLGQHFLRRARDQMYYGSLVDRLANLIDPLPHDPWPRHSDHTGASLAVRAKVYAAVGGLPALPFREDLAFVSLARGAGYHLRHPLNVRVKVSARLEGRARGGMADCLRTWLDAETNGLPHLVEDPASVLARLHRRYTCRQFGLVENRHVHHARSSATAAPLSCAERAVESITPEEPDALLGMPVKTAIRQIKRMIGDKESEIRVV